MRGGGSGAPTIIKFWTMEGHSVGFLIGVAEVLVRSMLGGDEGSGSVLSGGPFEGASDGNLEGVGIVEGDPIGVLSVT